MKSDNIIDEIDGIVEYGKDFINCKFINNRDNDKYKLFWFFVVLIKQIWLNGLLLWSMWYIYQSQEQR